MKSTRILVLLAAVCSDAYVLSPTSSVGRARRASVPTLLAQPNDDVESSRAALNAALMRDATRLKGFGVAEQQAARGSEEEAGVLKQLSAVVYVAACATIGWNYSWWLNRLLGQWRFLLGVAVGVAAETLRRNRVAKQKS